MNPNEIFNRIVSTLSRWTVVVADRIRVSRGRLLVIAVMLLVLSFGALAYALRDRAPDPALAGMGPEEEAPAVNIQQRALDGVLVDASSTHLLPIGVMVENSPDAWPLQGPAKANLVFEAEVEGGITRFFLVFDASSTVPEIGPVRSARPYFVDWATGLDALYAHVGGSPDALSRIASSASFRDLNEFWNGWAFWRSATRAAPHNVMTRLDLLVQAAGKEEYVPGSFEPWVYIDPPTSTVPETEGSTGERVLPQLRSGQAPESRILVPYQGIFAVEWRYDAETDLYTRYRNESVVRDADGTAVTAKNVVVMLTDAQAVDELGRLDLRTTGRGKAIIASAGGARIAEWVRVAGQHIRFEGIDGSDVAFRRGTTWISVLTSSSAFDKVLAE